MQRIIGIRENGSEIAEVLTLCPIISTESRYTHSKLVFADSHHLRLTVLESDEGMLPVTYMVTPTDAQDFIATVETREEELRAAKGPATLLDSDQHSRCLTISPT